MFKKSLLAGLLLVASVAIAPNHEPEVPHQTWVVDFIENRGNTDNDTARHYLLDKIFTDLLEVDAPIPQDFLSGDKSFRFKLDFVNGHGRQLQVVLQSNMGKVINTIDGEYAPNVTYEDWALVGYELESAEAIELSDLPRDIQADAVSCFESGPIKLALIISSGIGRQPEVNLSLKSETPGLGFFEQQTYACDPLAAAQIMLLDRYTAAFLDRQFVHELLTIDGAADYYPTGPQPLNILNRA